MRVLNLLGLLLLVATRPTRSVTPKPGQGWGEPLGSGQANAPTTIASSTISDTMSPSQGLAMPHDKTQGVNYAVLEFSTCESNLLKRNSLLAFDFFNINRVDQFGESSAMNEWHSSPGSKIDASHISIDSQQLSQEGENLHCLIDLNRIPTEPEILPSKDFLENLVPDNRSVHQFGDSSSMNEWDSGPGSKIDESHIRIDSQQLSQERENLDCRIDLNRIPTDSEILPSKGFLDNLVPDNRNAHLFGDSSSRNLADWTLSASSNRDASRISIDGQQSIESVEGTSFDCRIENTSNSKNQPDDVRENFVTEGFPEQIHKMVKSRKTKHLVELKMLCRRLNWDLDEVKDYDSLCVFLGNETNPEQVEFHNSVAITEYMMELLGKSGWDTVEVGQNNIDVPDKRLIAKATSTPEKLIVISNFVLKLVSCRRSLCSISPRVINCLKRTCIPVLQCLVKCCGKDMDLFQKRWGTRFNHRYFGLTCCPGRGLNHNTCGYQRTKIVRNPDNSDKNSGLLDLNALVLAISMSKTAEEKLKLCCEFNERYRSSGHEARYHLRQYHSQSPKPIWGCFVHHCGQNTSEWIRKWGPRFAHGGFRTRKCQGLKSLQCGSIDRPFDIPARLCLRGKSARKLLPALSEIFEQYDQFVIAKTAVQRSPHPGLTVFIRRCRPVYNCLHRHCTGSVNEFVRRWGTSVHYTKFSNYCPGIGRKESDICQYESRSSKGQIRGDPSKVNKKIWSSQ